MIELIDFLQELYTRKNPFPDLKNCLAISRSILSGPPDRPSDDLTCCRMTHNWWAMCSDCWERDPLLRPSMSNLLSRIESTEVRAHLYMIPFPFSSKQGNHESNSWAQHVV